MTFKVATAATGVLRDQHFVYSTLFGTRVRTLLLEAARTNAVTYSDDLTNAAWTKTAATAAKNATGPDGVANSASTLTENGANAAHFATQGGFTITANKTQAASAWVKASGRAQGVLYLTDGSGNQCGVSYDLGIVTAASQTSGTGSVASVGIEPSGNGDGWFRVFVTGKLAAASTTAAVVLILANGASTTYAGDSASGVQVFALQHERDSTSVSSPISTTSAPVTRNADSLLLPHALVPGPLTFYVRFFEQVSAVAAGTLATIFSVGSVTTPASLYVYRDPTNGYQLVYYGIASAGQSSGVSLASRGQLVEVRVAISASGAATIGVSVDKGAEGVGGPTAALGNPTSFASANIEFNADSGGTDAGLLAMTHFAVAVGSKSLSEMRSIAGV